MLSIIAFLALLAAASAGAGEGPAGTKLQVLDGVMADGSASPQWLELLRKRLAPAQFAAIAPLHKPLTAPEQAWAQLIRSRTADWGRAVGALATAYEPAPPPQLVRIVIGNRGGEDAFTHDPRTIGFDLAALQANYGAASDPQNPARMDRFFRHEFVHLMQKSWFTRHPAELDTPLRLALVEMWTEGLGNHESLSARWVDEAGGLSAHALRTLADLEPRLVARLAALACVPGATGRVLTTDLSNGRFDAKWGALPVALWLQREAQANPDAKRELVHAGPAGIWTLAERHLAPPLRAVAAEARRNASLCEGRN